MNAIAQELDTKLATLLPAKAASLERIVRDAIELASTDKPPLTKWPAGFFDRVRQQWGDEPFDRPSHGQFETRVAEL